MKSNNSDKVKGLNLSNVSLLMLILSVFLALITILGLLRVNKSFKSVTEATDSYIDAMDNIYSLSEAVESISNHSRQFVLSGKIDEMDSYIEEVEITKIRENAIAAIKKQFEGEDATIGERLDHILEVSQSLEILELHAMKLTTLRVLTPDNRIPDSVYNYTLTESEINASNYGNLLNASDLVFGVSYRHYRSIIDEDIKSLSNDITKYVQDKQASSAKALGNALIFQRIFIVLLVLIVLVIFIILLKMVIVPMNEFVESIHRNKPINPSGASELQYFASIYNKIFDVNIATKNELKDRADHDALTGLLNRNAFDDLCTILRKTKDNLALIIIDVDHFKEVNDVHGHEVGDLTLKNVSELLFVAFRSDDFVIRYGGDEFVIIMTNATKDITPAISQKLSYLNNTLQNPSNPILPVMSISAGIAFSTWGYDEELFNRADKALYYTKEHGRCGFTFFDPETM